MLNGYCSSTSGCNSLHFVLAFEGKTPKIQRGQKECRSPSMQNQKGCSDCGLFAVAVAFSFLIGEDPSTQAYDQKTMQVHLAMCFQVGELAQFPVNASVLPMQHERKEVVKLFCHCRIPYCGSFMIECATCAEWFHRSCENVTRKVYVNSLCRLVVHTVSDRVVLTGFPRTVNR